MSFEAERLKGKRPTVTGLPNKNQFFDMSGTGEEIEKYSASEGIPGTRSKYRSPPVDHSDSEMARYYGGSGGPESKVVPKPPRREKMVTFSNTKARSKR